MKSHRTDFVALVAGLLFLGIGAVYMVAAYGDFTVDSRWIGPAALIGIGLAGLAATVATGRGEKDEPAP